MNIDKKWLRTLEKTQQALKHPGKTWGALFAEDDSAGWMFGLISSLSWFFLAFSNSNFTWPVPAVLVVGVAVFFFVSQMYQIMPTSDEHWGRAPMRANSWFFYTLGIIVLAMLYMNSSLLWQWAEAYQS